MEVEEYSEEGGGTPLQDEPEYDYKLKESKASGDEYESDGGMVEREEEEEMDQERGSNSGNDSDEDGGRPMSVGSGPASPLGSAPESPVGSAPASPGSPHPFSGSNQGSPSPSSPPYSPSPSDPKSPTYSSGPGSPSQTVQPSSPAGSGSVPGSPAGSGGHGSPMASPAGSGSAPGSPMDRNQSLETPDFSPPQENEGSTSLVWPAPSGFTLDSQESFRSRSASPAVSARSRSRSPRSRSTSISPARSARSRSVSPAGSARSRSISPARSGRSISASPAGNTRSRSASPAGNTRSRSVSPAMSTRSRSVSPAESARSRSVSPAGSARSRSGTPRSRSISPAGSARSRSGSRSGSARSSRSGTPRSRSVSPAGSRSRSGTPRSRSVSPAGSRSRSVSPAGSRSRSGTPRSRSVSPAGSARSRSVSPAVSGRSRSASPAVSRSRSRSRSGTPVGRLTRGRLRSMTPASDRSRSGSRASGRSRSGSPYSGASRSRSRSVSPVGSGTPPYSPLGSRASGSPPGSPRDSDDDRFDSDVEKGGEKDLVADIFGSSDEEEEFEGFAQDDVEATAQKEKKTAMISDDEDDAGMATGHVDSGRSAHQMSDDENDEAARRDARGEGDGEDAVSDFDRMMALKKEEMRKRRRKRKDCEVINDSDDLIVDMIQKMKVAAEEDRGLNMEKQPAIRKLRYLPTVLSQLKKADLHMAFLDCGILSAMTEWLAPLPDKSLPNLQIRESFLKILGEFPTLHAGALKTSGVGKAIMYLYKHPKEVKENREKAGKLINEWSRPLFNLTSNYKSLSKEEREQRDYDQLPKRRRTSMEEGGMTPRKDLDKSLSGEQKALRPGDPGWVYRARVPRPSNKDYVIRPQWRTDEDADTPKKSSGKKEPSRYQKHVRKFQEKKKNSKLMRAVPISIEGRNMAL